MRRHFYSKVFFFYSLFSVILFVIYVSRTIGNQSYNLSDSEEMLKSTFESKSDASSIYILEWTSPYTEPFAFLGHGHEGFKKRGCRYTNCYITSDRSYLKDITKFDVVIFHGPEINKKKDMANMPAIRSPHQKFVFVSMESSHNYPVCSNKFDNYFNWTWTYRLDSDARLGYIYVTDINGTVIGPKKIMHWLRYEDMLPVDVAFKEKLKTKSKAAAWFVSNCDDQSGRMKIALKIKTELEKYNLQLDIYGKCGPFSCPRFNRSECDRKIAETYYFYLAFENSFSEDYVTEKLLHALQNNAVPVVYGAANYSRFMPNGIYLNAMELGVERLVAKMNNLINNPEIYAEYFRWKNHYEYRFTNEDDSAHNEYCGLCALMNDVAKMKEITVVKKFRQWWDNPDLCKHLDLKF
ncbi:unnamed protein product [Diatraea saccharalis]|uniref:Fucosyltransferase n=1 Tax=Diatraea saccharalis TaxID=40085 RepID=A0A9N9QYE2_9NEOP|nr:unnamed protein product [Diatraea saccharalis]